MLSTEMKDTVDGSIDSYGGDKSHLITIMQEIQKVYRYLPEDALVRLAEKIGLSQAKVFGVATFYENFSLEPKGKNIIKICDGTACHVRKSIPILTAIRKELNLSESKRTTDDSMFTVETVSCLGACGLAPVLTLNDHVHPKMTPEAAVELIRSVQKEEN